MIKNAADQRFLRLKQTREDFYPLHSWIIYIVDAKLLAISVTLSSLIGPKRYHLRLISFLNKVFTWGNQEKQKNDVEMGSFRLINFVRFVDRKKRYCQFGINYTKRRALPNKEVPLFSMKS